MGDPQPRKSNLCIFASAPHPTRCSPSTAGNRIAREFDVNSPHPVANREDPAAPLAPRWPRLPARLPRTCFTAVGVWHYFPRFRRSVRALCAEWYTRMVYRAGRKRGERPSEGPLTWGFVERTTRLEPATLTLAKKREWNRPARPVSPVSCGPVRILSSQSGPVQPYRIPVYHPTPWASRPESLTLGRVPVTSGRRLGSR